MAAAVRYQHKVSGLDEYAQSSNFIMYSDKRKYLQLQVIYNCGLRTNLADDDCNAMIHLIDL